MCEEEIINNFNKEQLQLLITKLKDIDNYTGFKDGAFKYYLGKYEANILLNYIDKLQQIIDKATEYNNYLKEHCKYRLNDGHLRKMGKILIGDYNE